MDNENDDIDNELNDENSDEYIKKLRERLKICRKEKNEYLYGWQRAKADFINARRDEEKRIENSAQYAKSKVLNEFLKLANSIDMAEKHISSEEFTQIYRQLSEILKQQGVQLIECIGEKFNPELHEALMQTEAENEDNDHIIVEELQKGYMMNDKVLRPSKVKVSIYKD